MCTEVEDRGICGLGSWARIWTRVADNTSPRVDTLDAPTRAAYEHSQE